MKEVAISEFKGQVPVSARARAEDEEADPGDALWQSHRRSHAGTAQGRPGDWIGSMKGRFEMLGDTVSPADDEQDGEVLRAAVIAIAPGYCPGFAATPALIAFRSSSPDPVSRFRSTATSAAMPVCKAGSTSGAKSGE